MAVGMVSRHFGLVVHGLFLQGRNRMAFFTRALRFFRGKQNSSRNHSRRLHFAELEPRLLLSSQHIDFGTDSSPVASGYVGASLAGYSASAGAGWLNTKGMVADNRSTGNALNRDFVAGQDNTFQLDVPSGYYLVTLRLGDTREIRDHIDVYLNGQLVASDLTIAAGNVIQPTYETQVTDGHLKIRLVDHGGETVRWTLTGLDVTSTTAGLSAGPDKTVELGDPVTIYGKASSDNAMTYSWDFGDGKGATGTLRPTHTYAKAGKYTVTLTATDSKGVGSKTTTTVTVTAPSLAVGLIGIPTSAKEGTSITLGSKVTDPRTGDTVSGCKYSWTVTKDGSKYATGTSSKITFTPTDDGSYVVTLKVTDAKGHTVSTTKTIQVADVPMRVNALGTYTGNVGTAVDFAGVARDVSTADMAAGFTYNWNFGDGTTAKGATVSHTYKSAGTYTVTLKVTDKDGVSRTTTTTAKIGTSTSTSENEYKRLSTSLLGNVVYKGATTSEIASSGAWGVNADWEKGKSSKWYIEQQRYGESLIIEGILNKDTTMINLGLKVFNWGFSRQASDGSFKGTEDAFHSTSMFVAAVSHTLLVLKQSPYASQYASQIDSLTAKVYKAAQWMTGTEVWSRGIKNDSPYTHRRYLVANALALTSKLVGGDSQLMSLARLQIKDALSLQWSNGVNPEKGGYDSSYQTVGLSYAMRWSTYFPNESLTASVNTMIDKGLAWEQGRILSTGEISTAGNSRVGTAETGPSGTLKTVDWRKAVTAFAYWYQVTGNTAWQIAAQKISQWYFQSY
jgi:PKD repeat protein